MLVITLIFRWFESLIDVFNGPVDTMPPRSVRRFYLFFIRQVWKVFAAAILVSFGVAIVEVSLFQFIGKIVDMTTSMPERGFFREHGNELILMSFVILIARPALTGLHDMLINQAILPNLTSRIRWQNHRYVVRQSLTFFQNDYAGRLANRIMITGSALRESAVQIADAGWYALIYTSSVIVIFFEIDSLLIIPITIWIFTYGYTLVYFIPRLRRRSWQASATNSKLMGRIVDGYSNIVTLKLFSHTQREDSYVAEAITEQTEALQNMTRLTTAMDFLITALDGSLIVATSGLAIWLWSQGYVSVGTIALSTGLVIRINSMSSWFMWLINGIFGNVGVVQDGVAAISQPCEVRDRKDATSLEVKCGEVRFEDIYFCYGRQREVITGLNLIVKPGEKIGLVGISGAGKSTLINLLLRLYELEKGRICIDDQDIALVMQESLRAQIGVVTQDTSLLHRSVRDNLLYGRPDADEYQLIEAVRKARVDEFIDDLIDGDGRRGFDALVGERGVKLSGGQRQRISIARVLLKNPPIIVLDEATSALDSESELAIQENLDLLTRDKTVIAIAHRLSTIARMDRLVVIDKGFIVESGTHTELIALDGLYARLWQRQTRGFIAVNDVIAHI